MLNFLKKEDGKRERRGAKSAVGKSPTVRKGSPREGLED